LGGQTDRTNKVNPTALERWRSLGQDVERQTYFATLAAAVREYYFSDPSNPYRQSGRSSGKARWEATRRFILQAVHKSGDFMDVGCADGLLLESLAEWARDSGVTLRPHGVDFVPELVALAQARFPASTRSFHVANAFEWAPTRRYDFVRTNLEYVPESDRASFVRAQIAWVAPGGRLILCHYRNANDPHVEPSVVAQHAGLSVTGFAEVPGTAIAWVDATTQ
jgi:2-polyprenyl-3-methyl-5-hydroxy-6-metoxy-1,4-benzoquinol methylase